MKHDSPISDERSRLKSKGIDAMRWREAAKYAAKNAGGAMLGSALGGAILGFLIDIQPFGHGRDQSLTAEGALAGAVFGLLAGTVYLAPIAALLGGLLGRFVGGHAANVSAMIFGGAIFAIAAVLAVFIHFNYFGLAM